MEERNSQDFQDIRVRIHSIKTDGTDNTGDAVNLSTIVKDPSGAELTPGVDYDEATFTEIGTTGNYELLFAKTAVNKLFTEIDADNPYEITLISSTVDVGSNSESVQIVSERAAGARQITIHVQDGIAAPIPDVFVRIADATGAISLTTGYTDASGDVVFALDDGSYQVILRKALVNFTVPESLTVTADATETYTGDVLTPSAPVEPDTCVVYGTVIDLSGAVVSGAEIFIQELDSETFAGTEKIVKDIKTTSDAAGFWELETIRSSAINPKNSYRAIIRYRSFEYKAFINVPDQNSVEFSTIIV